MRTWIANASHIFQSQTSTNTLTDIRHRPLGLEIVIARGNCGREVNLERWVGAPSHEDVMLHQEAGFGRRFRDWMHTKPSLDKLTVRS